MIEIRTRAVLTLLVTTLGFSLESRGMTLEGTTLYDKNISPRAITGENWKGEKGQGGKALGGRKGSPAHWHLKPGENFTFAEIDGPGMIRHIWMTVGEFHKPARMRNIILRFYWDGQETPSVEAPMADFFGISHGCVRPLENVYQTIAEGRGFNCYFPMPFAKKAKLVICNENTEEADPRYFFFQVDYTVRDKVDKNTPYFHAQFRRVPRTTLQQDYVILDGIKSKGRFLGANIGVYNRYAHTNTWWGEGEVKIYLDGDTDYPTICGTGTEDYAGSAFGIGQYSNRYFGAPVNENQKYISFYRFHVLDPVYFHKDLKVTIQQIGYEGPANPEGPMKEFIEKGEYKSIHNGLYERVDDVCSTAYWYQMLPTAPFPPFPDKEIRTRDLPEK